MPTPITPDRYDPATAAAMAGLGNGTDGLPAYLGIRTTHVGPATMTAELDVRTDLLNPFGTLHGGVLAALVDHVLGAVLYPVIEARPMGSHHRVQGQPPRRGPRGPPRGSLHHRVAHPPHRRRPGGGRQRRPPLRTRPRHHTHR